MKPALRRSLMAAASLIVVAGGVAILSGRLPLPQPPLGLVRDLVRRVITSLRGLMEEPTPGGMAALVGISFVYGVVHSAGPGHGKALIASYLMRQRHGLAASVALPAVSSLTHTLGAVVLAALLTLVLTGIKGMFRIQLHGYLMLANGVVIVGVGFIYLVVGVVSRRRSTRSTSAPRSRIVWLGMVAGMAPCPGSLMVLLFAIARDALWLGLLSVTGISLGMFALLAPVAVATSRSREGLLACVQRFDRSADEFGRWLEYGSVVFIITIGVVMIVSSI